MQGLIAATFLWLLVHHVVVQRVDAMYTFEVKVLSYQNPTSQRASNGRCCDNGGNINCVNRCDNRFLFCLRNAGQSKDDTTENCPLGMYEFVTANNRDNIMFTTSFINQDTPNPLVFNGSVWPGAFQLFIRINDRDNRSDGSVRLQRVDDIFVERSITPNLTFTNTMTHIGENNFSRVELRFRVTCSENFYGPNCTTFCIPMDTVQGHYTCDQDGEIVCNAGYTNTSTNCVECLPAEGCSPTRGYCTHPGECLCYEGYTGTLCEMTTTSSGIVTQSNSTDSTQSNSGVNTEPRPPMTVTTVPSGLPTLITDIRMQEGAPHNASSSGKVAGAVVGTLLGVALLGTVVAVALIVLWRRGHLGTLLSNIIPCRKTSDQSTWIPGDNPTYNIVEFRPAVPQRTTDEPSLSRDTEDNPLYMSTALDSFSSNTTETSRVEDSVNGSCQTQSSCYINVSKPDVLASPSRMNPYGDYGEKTLQRVASIPSITEMEGSQEYSAKHV